MAQSHLKTAELLALREGDLSSPASVEHLASCPVCQETFDDTRWTLLLRRLPEIVDAGPHPSADELLAFRSYAMPSSRVLEIRRHLRSCQKCLAIYGRARSHDKRTAYSSPSPEVLARVRQRFRPRKIRTLGTLLVTRIGEGLRAFFTPASAYHPGSASDRAIRLESQDEAAALDLFACESVEPAPIRCLLNRIGRNEPRPPARIEAEGWTIEMTPLSRTGGSYIGVRVRAADPGTSVRGVRIRIVARDGKATDAVTDRNGKTELVFHPGRSTIQIGTRPPVAVGLDFPDSL